MSGSTYCPAAVSLAAPTVRMPPKALQGKSIAFAGNAVFGQGGQGEFLRQMVFVIGQLSGGIVVGRRAVTQMTRSIGIPFSMSARRLVFDCIRSLPLLRRRQDWMTLLSDLDFDDRLTAALGNVDLLDAVSGQCCNTFHNSKRNNTRILLTSLNTHMDYLLETLQTEHKAIGFEEWSFIHPRMRKRVLSEIELADRIRVNSHWAKETFVDRGVNEERIEVVHPAVDHEQFHPVPKTDDVFRVLAVSSIDPRKGIHYLLQAFEQACIPNSELIIIGGTGDRWSKQMLRSFQSRNSNVRQRVLDVSAVPVSQTYGAASVLVHAALEDGYGLVIAQALASGCPVIATRQSGASELITHGQNGFVLERRCVKSICEYLQLMASDETMRQQMRHEAPRATARLGYADFAVSVMSLYSKVLG